MSPWHFRKSYIKDQKFVSTLFRLVSSSKMVAFNLPLPLYTLFQNFLVYFFGHNGNGTTTTAITKGPFYKDLDNRLCYFSNKTYERYMLTTKINNLTFNSLLTCPDANRECVIRIFPKHECCYPGPFYCSAENPPRCEKTNCMCQQGFIFEGSSGKCINMSQLAPACAKRFLKWEGNVVNYITRERVNKTESIKPTAFPKARNTV